MRVTKDQALVILLIPIYLTLPCCASRRVTRELTQVTEAKNINPDEKYLKIHLKNGNLYVLHSWKINESQKVIIGAGNYLDFNRRIIESRGGAKDNRMVIGDFDPFEIQFNEIVVVETNDKGNNPGIAAMVVAGLFTVPLSIYCLTNPKACFGSCPTFYVQRDTGSKLVAEGFSSSISRSLEERDVDLLDCPLIEGDSLQITMKNEALETHVVRALNLLACKKTSGSRVLQEVGGDFYEINKEESPVKAMHRAKSIFKEIEKKDQVEWYSLADSLNLAKREDIFLEFENPGKEVGLVLTKRQSLMTTYLFYHTLSLMGHATSYYMSEMETRRPGLKKRITSVYDLLGGIDVAVLNRNNKWIKVSTIREAGPIAEDTHFVRLPLNNSKQIKVKVRLRMSQGLWRINKIGLSTIVGKVIPERIVPTVVYRGLAKNQNDLKKLLSNEDCLTTFPGDVYRISYPALYKKNVEYFIESQGYYIEWMREEWLKDENIRLAKKIFLNPSGYLKKMAPYYKSIEPEMEKVFWNSRYTKLED